MSLRLSLRIPALARPRSIPIRAFTSSPLRSTTTGYGDPQDEKAANHTQTSASSPDPQPGGQGKGPGQQSGSTDPEVKPKSSSKSGEKKKSSGKGKTGSAGGESGAGNKEVEQVTGNQIRETKKVGEDPKKEEAEGAGPIGG